MTMFNLNRLKKIVGVSFFSSSSYMLYNYVTDKKGNTYTTDEVITHNTENDLWVTYKNKVYDITKFINVHPGGKDKLLMAAGDSIDYYWNIYKQHKTPTVYDILNKYEIGELKNYKREIFDNEYENEPIRNEYLKIIHKYEPFNAELVNSKLTANYLTHENDWFIRNHHPVPNINIDSYELFINGNPFKYNDITQLKTDEIITTIQCAGNRRKELNSINKTLGLSWEGGAISTGKWEGVWLKDIIDIPNHKKYINLYDYNHNFSVSVPIDSKIFLAFKMNDQVLSRDRGYPIRVIVPGYTGSKQVKWIQRIEFSDKEVDSPWQTGIAYKILPKNITNIEDITQLQKVSIPTINILPVQSYICNIKKYNKYVLINGYAISGNGNKIKKVEVSSDNGKNWKEAIIYKGNKQSCGNAMAWIFWKIHIPITENNKPNIEYICRAVDEKGHYQNKTPADLWNIRGIQNNSMNKKLVKNVK